MSVSVVIKALNEAERIGAAIESALEALGGKGEVIVADSGSTDGTIEIAARYPVILVQLEKGEAPSCGLGPQLGYQYSREPFICLMDGDMELDPRFISEALAFLEAHPDAAGVGGHVVEMNMESLEFARRVARGGVEYRVGEVDRLNGGGLYRRAAIEAAGHFSDRNLHGYEEFDLGVRLRDKGWRLHRLDIPFARHYGYTMNAYKLLVRRWQSKYLRGVGELLRAAWGRSHWNALLSEVRELRLWALVYLGAALALALLVFMPDKGLALGLCLAGALGVLALMSLKHKSLGMGLYAVTAWVFHTAALPLGFFHTRRDPGDWIPSRVVSAPEPAERMAAAER